MGEMKKGRQRWKDGMETWERRKEGGKLIKGINFK